VAQASSRIRRWVYRLQRPRPTQLARILWTVTKLLDPLRTLDSFAARRVLVIAPQPFYEDRGTPIAVRELLAALAGLGFEVDLATFPVGRGVDIPGVRVIRTPNVLRIRHVPIGFSARKLLLDVFLFFTVHRLLRTHRYFSVHGVEEGGFIATLLGRGVGVPVIYEMQSSLAEQLAARRIFRPEPVRRLLHLCERWLLRRVDLVACSAGLASHVSDLAPTVAVREWSYPVLSAQVPVHDVEVLRQELLIPAGAAVVLYSGNFAKYQGLDEVMKAIPRVSAEIPGTVFVLVGADSAGAARVARQAARLGLNGQLKVVSRRPVNEIAQYHALANVLLAPRAVGSNLSLKVFHYMAAGRPMIVTGAGASRQVLEERGAFVVEHTTHAIAEAVIRLLREPALASSLAARARAYAHTHLGPANFARSVSDMCDLIVRPHRL
jgi:glycosyltransferase involved in cell wall biosynthesis